MILDSLDGEAHLPSQPCDLMKTHVGSDCCLHEILWQVERVENFGFLPLFTSIPLRFWKQISKSLVHYIYSIALVNSDFAYCL